MAFEDCNIFPSSDTEDEICSAWILHSSLKMLFLKVHFILLFEGAIALWEKNGVGK